MVILTSNYCSEIILEQQPSLTLTVCMCVCMHVRDWEAVIFALKTDVVTIFNTCVNIGLLHYTL